ncbi:TOMM precursor leader peptide-binding protein [Streptomyces sp. NPDC047108]|uniref:TOMM precursor leader peptide-binding protein n=1 Tax=Streptomyces sp. NPDC047108 TaxID=3155025 RepID=UPI0033DB5861
MAAEAFEALAGTRPRVSRDVLFTETPGGVLFHNADGGFHLTGRTAYRFASLLVPHLNGHHTLAAICDGLGPAQQAMAAELVKTLYKRGYARDIPAEDIAAAAPAPGPEAEITRRFAAQIAYVDHYADTPADRFRRFRATKVAVLGRDAVAEWCALSLVRNGCARIGVQRDFAAVRDEAGQLTADGCPVEIDRLDTETTGTGAGAGAAQPGWDELADYDVVVVTGTDAARHAHRLLSGGVPEGRTLIPAWSFGNRSVIGPLSTSGSRGCWSCALLRLGANVDAGAAADIWREVASGRAAPSPVDGALIGPVAAMSGNLLGYEVFRLATGALPSETDRQILVQDLESLDVVAEPLHPHPECALCPPAADVSEEAGQVLATGLSLPRTPTVETARDAEGLVDDLNRTSDALVRPLAGVFTRYDDEELTQTPLKISRVEIALGHGRRRTIAAFDVHHLAGARMRALYAAAEAYVEHVVPLTALASPPSAQEERTASRPAVLGPAALTTGGGTGASENEVTAWTTASSLLTKEDVLVPAAAVRTYGQHNRGRLHLATRAGAGAGATPQEAAGRGLLSALSHDALLHAVRGTARVSPVTEDGLGEAGSHAELVFLLKSARNLGVEVELLDLGESERSGAYAVLARETSSESGGAGPARWTVGCDLSRAAAASAALRDLLGAVQLAAETADPDAATDAPGTAVDTGDPLVVDLDAGTVAVTDGPVAADAAAVSWEAVLDRLRAAGRDVLVVPTTPGDLPAGGIRTARVLLTVRAAGGADAH